MKLARIGLVIITSLALMALICPSVQADGESDSVDLSATVALAVSDVSASGIGRYSATISWKTNGDATSQVFYDTAYQEDIGDYARSAEDTDLASNHSVHLTGLSSGRTYHYRVRSAAVIDGTDFVATSEDCTFRTSSPAPAPPPPVPEPPPEEPIEPEEPEPVEPEPEEPEVVEPEEPTPPEEEEPEVAEPEVEEPEEPEAEEPEEEIPEIIEPEKPSYLWAYILAGVFPATGLFWLWWWRRRKKKEEE